MGAATFDPTVYKTTTRRQWEDAAEAWHRWGPTLETWLDAATTAMLDAAGVGPGAQVLDVAAGAGGQTLEAARRAGAAGRDEHGQFLPEATGCGAAAATGREGAARCRALVTKTASTGTR